VSGRITDANGDPAPRMLVVAIDQMKGDTYPHAPGLGTTDATGRYRIPDLPEGLYVLVMIGDVEDDDAANMSLVKSARVTPDAWTEVDFLGKEEGTLVTGRLLDDAGEPVPNAMLTLMRSDVSDEEQRENWQAATTSADGTFEFQNIEPGPYLAVLTQSAGMNVTLLGEIQVADIPVVRQDVRMPARSIEGRLVAAATGAPLGYSFVILFAVDETGAMTFVSKQPTDADGRFRFDHLQQGVYRVFGYAAEEGFGIGRADGIQAPALDVTVQVPPGGTIVARVVDPSGAPVADAQLVLVPAGQAFQRDWDPPTGADGQAHLTGVDVGAWTVRATKKGFAAGTADVTVVAGGRYELTIRLGLEDS
jgi:hypothetical protein